MSAAEYPEAAKHCGCLGHRAGRPDRHIAEPEVAESAPDRFRELLHDITIGARNFQVFG